MFTDSKQLFVALTPARRTKHKKLMIDLSTASDTCKRFEINAIELVRGDPITSDGLTKEKNNKMLQNLLEGKDNTSVELWIEREK